MNKFLLCPLVLLLVGCQALGIGNGRYARHNVSHVENTAMLSSFTPKHHALIAENLVHILVQLQGVSPVTTTVQLPEVKTPFGATVHKAIINAGYGHQFVTGDIGETLLRYKAENAETEAGYRTLYRLEIGPVFVEREYRVDRGVLLPTSPFRVSGNNDDLALNDFIFDESANIGESSYVVAGAEAAPKIKLFDKTGANIPQYSLIENPQTPSIISSTKPLSDKHAVNNIYKSKQSAYKELFDNYDGVTTQILVFPNDSLRLGAANKKLIRSLTRSFDPESEVFSVLGCSQGKTALKNGNEYLAVGRAARVKEELIRNGIAASSIFDEGCWGGHHSVKTVPTRGVVLSRKRQNLG